MRAFAADPRPSLLAYAHSDFYMVEANVKGADYFFPLFGRGLRLGVGYVNANLNSDAWVALSGTFRDVSNSAAHGQPSQLGPDRRERRRPDSLCRRRNWLY